LEPPSPDSATMLPCSTMVHTPGRSLPLVDHEEVRSVAGVGLSTTALLTDQYELTMLQGALRAGTASRRSVFEVFARHLPAGRRYGVVAGTGRLLDALAAFTFDEAALSFLAGIVDEPTLEYLAGYRFAGSAWGYAEGDCYFPGSPILVVEG